MRRLISFVTVIMAMVVLTRGTASAQQPVCSWPRGEPATEESLLTHAQQWQQEAATRGNRDSKSYTCLVAAAKVLHTAHRFLEAGRVMERAAVFALDWGNVAEAARAFVLASVMAEGEPGSTEPDRLIHLAELLAVSSQLSAADRTAIAQRRSQIASAR